MRSFSVRVGGLCFGFVVEAGFVTHIAPVASYARGWTVDRAVDYFRRRGTIIETTGDEAGDEQ